MKKQVKLIASALVVTGVFSVVSPCAPMFLEKVSASETEKTSLSDRQLRSIYLSEGDINFSASTYDYTVKVKSDVDDIRITAKPRNEDSTVSIDGSTVNDSDNYKQKVDLKYGKNEIKIKVEDENGKGKTYVLNIYRGNDSDASDDQKNTDEDNDVVHLKELAVDCTKFNFDKKTSQYYLNIPNDKDTIKVTAVPDCTESDYSDYSVKIDNDYVNNDDKFTKTVALEKGENNIQVVVKDKSDNDKIYTLIITRGSEVSNTTSYNNLDLSKHDPKYDPVVNSTNTWKAVNGRLKYFDASGKAVVNTWIHDDLTNKYYYMGSDGYRYTGWLYDTNYGHYYYLNAVTGEMETGWVYDNGKAYYLDSTGAWVK